MAGFWWRWVIATAAGLGLGMSAFYIVVIPNLMYYLGLTPLMLTGIVVMGVSGLFQAWVLRPYLIHMRWWIIASVVGWTIYSVWATYGGYLLPYARGGLELMLLFSRGDIYTGMTLGLVIGLFQWFVLRRHVPDASWWIAISGVGYGLGLPLAAGIGFTQMASTFGAPTSFRSPYVVLSESAVVGGALVGAITGFGLLWLLRQHFAAQQPGGDIPNVR